MTTFDEARASVERLLAEKSYPGVDLVLLERAIRDLGWGWYFSFDSRAHMESGLSRDALVGGGPIVVEKESGTIHQLVSGRPAEVQIAEIGRSLALGD